jgi:class 3 adenylate cyclase
MSRAEPSLTGPSPAESPEPPAEPEVLAGLAIMQALDDAIAFRRARLDAPCAGCAPACPCPDHAADARLIASYQQRHRAAYLRACAALSLDPAGAAAAAGDGDTQTLTAWAVGASVVARLRERAAAGPVLADLGDGPAVYVLIGDDLVEYPVADQADGLAS